jgi:hypothetical protein
MKGGGGAPGTVSTVLVGVSALSAGAAVRQRRQVLYDSGSCSSAVMHQAWAEELAGKLMYGGMLQQLDSPSTPAATSSMLCSLFATLVAVGQTVSKVCSWWSCVSRAGVQRGRLGVGCWGCRGAG